ncbi:hypothetical protein ACIPCA_14455 [Flavobacterium covae]|uniref:Phospholipase C/D domain-containing protein n=2 Tax=Flavobacteriaceae TaxID=49546 RepID=A0ABW8PJT1_9FLAO
MTRIRNVGGKIIETTKGNDIWYAKEDIVLNSLKSISFKGDEKGVSYGKPEDPPEFKIESQEQVVFIESDLYFKNTGILKPPYLNSKDVFDYITSKPFVAGIKGIFGKDIKHSSIKKLMENLKNGSVPKLNWKAKKGLSESELGFYHQKTVYLNENLIFEAEKDSKKNWLLFRVMLEETGHYIEDLLRNYYDDIGGETFGDEGTIFAADFIKYNNLLNKDFNYASFKIKNSKGEIRDFEGKVDSNNPSREEKSKDLIFIEDDLDDHGLVTLKNGEKINVEFFKIRGGGAIHEEITKTAAKKVGFVYDYRLDEGCAWPDVPCNSNNIETCYYRTWRDLDKKGTLAYESHNGSKQFWHSMAPKGKNTNEQVRNLILNQAKIWFTEAIKRKGDDGLFEIGKILHMVQDSYSLSHVQRNSKDEIIKFQGYDAQDSHKHGEPDKQGKSKEAMKATVASEIVLLVFKRHREEWKDLKVSIKVLENVLLEKIYPIEKGQENKIAGGSLEAYKK